MQNTKFELKKGQRCSVLPPPTARSDEGSAAERVAGPRAQPRARRIRGVMAKVGEGDERWIVKERADGQNCNNWHWTTKDVSGHTKKVLRAVPRASQRLEP